MNIIITMSFTNLSAVLRIDLVVLIILIGFLIFREFLNIYFNKYVLNQPDIKLDMGRLIDITMIPFIYIFIYVLIYRLLNSI
jgi:hypothetical protein